MKISSRKIFSSRDDTVRNRCYTGIDVCQSLQGSIKAARGQLVEYYGAFTKIVKNGSSSGSCGPQLTPIARTFCRVWFPRYGRATCFSGEILTHESTHLDPDSCAAVCAHRLPAASFEISLLENGLAG
jgi:hypothetical protein